MALFLALMSRRMTNRVLDLENQRTRTNGYVEDCDISPSLTLRVH